MADQACCNAGEPLWEQEYAGNGRIEDVKGYKVYVATPTADVANGAAVVFLYDIFGFGEPPKNGNVRRICDHLASLGFLCVMPDVYRGKPWDKPFPPPNPAEFSAWWNSVPTHENTVKCVAGAVVPWLRKTLKCEGRIGVAGTCWGGLESMNLAGDHAPGVFSAAASIHGAKISEQHAKDAKCPIMVLPGSSDASCEPLRRVLERRGDEVGRRSRVVHFTSHPHGFMAARGDWSTNAGAHAKVLLRMLGEFFAKNLLQTAA